MKRTMLGGKIHRAVVTEANVQYEGSISVDEDLLDAADILPGELVHVWDVTSAARLTTYTIAAPRGSGAICINGAAAHLVSTGDLVIVASFVELEDAEARAWKPNAVFVDSDNHVLAVRGEEAFRAN
ncbi:MAG: aspartate 1-decarboxylase [Coriobacteriia bacterium]|nr:aspartate 1-decarboxylase [Coriobacteriia bacterium]